MASLTVEVSTAENDHVKRQSNKESLSGKYKRPLALVEPFLQTHFYTILLIISSDTSERSKCTTVSLIHHPNPFACESLVEGNLHTLEVFVKL